MSLQIIRDYLVAATGEVDKLLEPPPDPGTPVVDVRPGDNLMDAIDRAPANAIVRIDQAYESDIGQVTINKPVRLMSAGQLRISSRIERGAPLPTLRAASITCAAPDVQFTGVRLVGQGGTILTTGERTLLDRSILEGRGTLSQHRGVMANSVDVIVYGSIIRDIWRDIDTQAIGCYQYTRNLKVLNTYLEASGENFMAGGADAASEAAIPDGILIDECDFDKPLEWKNRGDIGVKNLFELKNARNVTLRRSRLRNNWADAQSGNAIVLTVRNQNGSNPWARIENVLLEDLEVDDIGGLLSVLGRDYIHPSQVARNIVCRRWTVRGLSYEHTEEGRAATARPFSISAGPEDLVLEDIIVESDHASCRATIGFDNHAYPCIGLQLRRCKLPEGSYGITGSVPNVPVGIGQLAGHAPGYVWEDMTIVRPPNPVRSPAYPAGTNRIAYPG